MSDGFVTLTYAIYFVDMKGFVVSILLAFHHLNRIYLLISRRVIVRDRRRLFIARDGQRIFQRSGQQDCAGSQRLVSFAFSLVLVDV